ncbi:hypothetical protein FPV67DRAFT_1451230 [Lyophyllum atratum]|nr:hypothetical protein FPV67DRAFT_1451230 [Lyophyllum atratum]
MPALGDRLHAIWPRPLIDRPLSLALKFAQKSRPQGAGGRPFEKGVVSFRRHVKRLPPLFEPSSSLPNLTSSMNIAKQRWTRTRNRGTRTWMTRNASPESKLSSMKLCKPFASSPYGPPDTEEPEKTPLIIIADGSASQSAGFSCLVIGAGVDLSDEGRETYPLTTTAVTSVIEHPSAAITIVRPTAIVTLLAEWVRGTCKPTSFGPYVGGVLLVFGDVSASRTTKDGQTTLSTSGTDAPTALLLDRTPPGPSSFESMADAEAPSVLDPGTKDDSYGG